jgi:hypothetical protein
MISKKCRLSIFILKISGGMILCIKEMKNEKTIMLSVRGIYENGQVRLLEPVPHKKRVNVIVTILEDIKDKDDYEYDVDIHVFDDLVGVIDVRENGSDAHDSYISSQRSK